MVEPFFQYQDLIGVVMAGILGIIWWDLRGFRKEAMGLREEVAGVRAEFQGYKLEIQQEREELKDNINGKYLSVAHHKNICKIASLEMLEAMRGIVKDAIIEAHEGR